MAEDWALSVCCVPAVCCVPCNVYVIFIYAICVLNEKKKQAKEKKPNQAIAITYVVHNVYRLFLIGEMQPKQNNGNYGLLVGHQYLQPLDAYNRPMLLCAVHTYSVSVVYNIPLHAVCIIYCIILYSKAMPAHYCDKSSI